MAAFTKRSSNVKGNRCQRGNKVQGWETFLARMTSRGQRVVKMLVALLQSWDLRVSTKEDTVLVILCWASLSLLSRKSWIAYRSGSLGLHPVGIMKLVVLARDCLACKDLLHLHCSSKGWRLRCTDWASATWSGDVSCVLQTQEVLALPCRSTSTGYKHSNSTTSHAGANTMCIFT